MFVSNATAAFVRAWLAVHFDPQVAAFLFGHPREHLSGAVGCRAASCVGSDAVGLERPIGPRARFPSPGQPSVRRTGDLQQRVCLRPLAIKSYASSVWDRGRTIAERRRTVTSIGLMCQSRQVRGRHACLV